MIAQMFPHEPQLEHVRPPSTHERLVRGRRGIAGQELVAVFSDECSALGGRTQKLVGTPGNGICMFCSGHEVPVFT
eukprot:scaffold431_cov334-Pavlova_lutheri.AAC.83